MSFNWNNAAMVTIATALGEVPAVGSLLSGLVYILWPPDDNVWSDIKQQVEQLIDQDISQLVYDQVQNSLQGLNNNLNDYLTAVDTNDLGAISSTWISTNGDFDQQLPSFQASGYEVLLLPLFAQFANLHLTLLRDGVMFGSNWGWNPAYQASITNRLESTLGAYISYAQRIYEQGYQNVVNNTATDYHQCQPFLAVNTYVRQMTLSVLDFAQLWRYFDVTTVPVSAGIYREIYSDPVGTCDDSGAINLPVAPTQPPTQITVWGGDRIDAVQLTYPSDGGPGGVTQTARMGDQGSGSNNPPDGGVFNVSNNPVTVAAGLSGDVLNALSFTFQDGTNTGQLGGDYPGGGAFSFSYTGEILSSIHINGVSDFYGSADCAVFGFEYDQSQVVSLDALRTLYVSSPGDVTLENLAKRSVSKQVPIDELNRRASAEAWDAQRQEYREHLRSRIRNRSNP